MIDSINTDSGWLASADGGWADLGGAVVLEPATIGVGGRPAWSDYPIAGSDDDLDEDERYFLEDDEDDGADDDSDLDSDYDDDFDDEDGEDIDADSDSDDDDL